MKSQQRFSEKLNRENMEMDSVRIGESQKQ